MADITTTINSTTIQTVFGDGVAQAQLAAHVALTAGAHGITAYGSTLTAAANAGAARTVLQLGTAATTAATNYATAAQGLLADSAVQGKASLTNVGRLTRVTAAGTIGEALVAEDGAGNVTGLLSAAASSSAGGSLKSNNGTTCISWGAGGGANASTADGLAVGGALTVAASATITGTLTAIAAATQDAVRLQGRAGGTGSWVASFTPTTLTASRTITIPDLTGTLALTGAAQAVSFGALSSTALTSTGGVAVGGALSGATTGAFSSTVTTGRLTAAGTDATTVPASQVTLGGGVVRAAGNIVAGGALICGLNETITWASGFGRIAGPTGLSLRATGANAIDLQTNGTNRLTVAATGEVAVISTTASTSTTTGALTVAGGVGIAGRCAVNNMSLVDGITAPATQAGHAILYVDSADGDLKIKFGDGTVKTIVTDT
jgi:hypothetical protein